MKFRDFHPNVKIRLILTFVGSMMFNLAIPFLTIYLSQRLGHVIAGLALAIGIIVSFLSGLVGGYLSDRIGRKKLMLFGEALWFLSYAAMAVSNSPWFDWPIVTLIAGIVVQACWGIYDPAATAMMLDVTTPQSRKFMFSFFYWSSNLSIAVGGTIGAILFNQYKFELFLLLMAVSVVTFSVTALFIAETWKPEMRAQTDGQGSMLDMLRSYGLVLKDRIFIVYVMASMLLVSTEFHLTGYIGIRLSEQAKEWFLLPWDHTKLSMTGMELLGVLRTENTILVVLSSFFVAAIMKRFSEKGVMFTGFALYIAGYTYIVGGASPLVLFIAMLVGTLGEVMYVPVSQSFMGILAPENARSSYMFVSSLSHKGAMMISAGAVSLGGVLSPWAMAGLVLALALLGLGMLASIMPKLDTRRRHEEARATAAASSSTISA